MSNRLTLTKWRIIPSLREDHRMQPRNQWTNKRSIKSWFLLDLCFWRRSRLKYRSRWLSFQQAQSRNELRQSQLLNGTTTWTESHIHLCLYSIRDSNKIPSMRWWSFLRFFRSLTKSSLCTPVNSITYLFNKLIILINSLNFLPLIRLTFWNLFCFCNTF